MGCQKACRSLSERSAVSCRDIDNSSEIAKPLHLLKSHINAFMSLLVLIRRSDLYSHVFPADGLALKKSETAGGAGGTCRSDDLIGGCHQRPKVQPEVTLSAAVCREIAVVSGVAVLLGANSEQVEERSTLLVAIRVVRLTCCCSMAWCVSRVVDSRTWSFSRSFVELGESRKSKKLLGGQHESGMRRVESRRQ